MDEDRVLQLLFMGAFVLMLISALFVRSRGGSASGGNDSGGDGGGDGD